MMNRPGNKLYLSGPITGLDPQATADKFAAAEEYYRAQGYKVTNPIRHGLKADALWAEHIGKDITLLLGCDCMVLLEGWEYSRGCRIEVAVAKVEGIDTYEAESFRGIRADKRGMLTNNK